MFGFDPLTLGVGTLIWLAFKRQSGTKFGEVTPEREELFRNAMAHCPDANKLRALSKIFKDEGLKAQALLLAKRAEWRGRTDAVRARHAEIFQNALKSENVNAILEIAAIFDSMTATYKGSQLRSRAQMLNETALKKQGEAEAGKVAVKEAPKTPSIPRNTVPDLVPEAGTAAE